MKKLVLNVSEIKKFNRQSVNPETHESKQWYQLAAETSETFEGFKKDAEGNKVAADVNSISNNARTWWYAFTTNADAIIAAYELTLDGHGRLATEAGYAIQGLALLKDATIVVESTLYNAGDEYNGEVINQPMYIYSVVSVIPSTTYMTSVFATLRSEGLLGMFADESLSNDKLAAKWVAAAKAALNAAE